MAGKTRKRSTKTQEHPRFTKIGADGKPLPWSATFADGWEINQCKRTGRMWIVKRENLIHVPDWQKKTVEKVRKQIAKFRFGGFADWIIPQIEPLFDAHDRSRFGPAIDIEAFPDCPEDWFWSDTDYLPIEGCAWFVSAGSGSALGQYRSLSGFVRAVRGGQ